jgi:hypothetical protein
VIATGTSPRQCPRALVRSCARSRTLTSGTRLRRAEFGTKDAPLRPERQPFRAAPGEPRRSRGCNLLPTMGVTSRQPSGHLRNGFDPCPERPHLQQFTEGKDGVGRSSAPEDVAASPSIARTRLMPPRWNRVCFSKWA